MTPASLHPEDLFERVLFGTATRDEHSRVAEHLRQCAPCRAEQRLHKILAVNVLVPGSVSHEGDDASIENVLRRLRAPVSVADLTPAELPKRAPLARGRGRRHAWLLGAAALLLALSAAAMLLVRRSPGPTAPGAPSLSGALERPSWTVSPPTAPSEAEPGPEPTSDGLSPRPAASLGEPEASGPGPAAKSHASAALPTAAELFARATAARRAGDASAAGHDYRLLQRTYPRSAEALVSRLALGRLLLTSAPSEALTQFDAYLRGNGPLKAEALVGKARALTALGRKADARHAWSEILSVAPGSPYADQARSKLASP